MDNQIPKRVNSRIRDRKERAVILSDKFLYLNDNIFYYRDKSQALSKRSLIPSNSTRFYI